jgi:hypothetical protein
LRILLLHAHVRGGPAVGQTGTARGLVLVDHVELLGRMGAQGGRIRGRRGGVVVRPALLFPPVIHGYGRTAAFEVV